ncbi:hypothetical protein quinque_010128 [Culex quinquefasciatus]
MTARVGANHITKPKNWITYWRSARHVCPHRSRRTTTGPCEGAEVLRLKAQAETSGKELEKIHFSDWARFWMQVVDELRRGDIRSRKYNLRKVMVDGDIPPRVKKDAHAVILEFIRSRPPLRKASDRKLAPQPLKALFAPGAAALIPSEKGRVLKPVHPKLKTRPGYGATSAMTMNPPVVTRGLRAGH